MSEHDRIPPQDLQAEMALLGACLIDVEVMDEAAGIARPSDFYAHVHETIFGAMVQLHAANVRVDKITVASKLHNNKDLERVGGASYLTSLMDTVQTVDSARYLANLIVEKSKLRSIAHIARETHDRSFDESRNPDDIVRDVVVQFEGVAAHGADLDGYAMTDFEEIDEKLGHAYETPFPTLNKRIAGLRRKTLVCISAANRMGKSGFVSMIADHGARVHGPVGLFSLEQTVEECFARLVAMYSGLSLLKRELAAQGKLRLSETEIENWERAHMAQERVPLTLFSGIPRMTLADVRLRARRLKRKKPDLYAVVVDHVRELRDVRERGRRSEHEALEDIYHGLRDLARELDIVVVAVNHQNREAGDKKPTLYSQKGGGNPEEIADTALLLHRPKVDSKGADAKRAEIIIGKARNAIYDAVPLTFEGARHLFIDDAVGVPWWSPPTPEQEDLLEHFEGVFGGEAVEV